MTLQELLKKHLGDNETTMTSILEDMKANKIFTAGEENLDVRYTKLKDKNTALEQEHAESLKLIEELKAATAKDEETSKKIADYESKIAALEQQNAALAIDSAIKLELLSKGAKSSDIDYLMFKIKQGDELKLDKDGNVKGLDDRIAEMQKTYSSNFEAKSKKRVDVKDLPDDEQQSGAMTKEQFLKKSYAERVAFAENNPDEFKAMMNE